MSIKIKAVERNVSFQKNVEKWVYVMQADIYNKLPLTKVIEEAAFHSGLSKGAINAAWEAIGTVTRTWATEGHTVPIPGLGSLRFGVRSSAVADVNLVDSDLITCRRVVFTPSHAIREELAKTSVNITCYNRKGEIVKRVTSTDGSQVETEEEDDSTQGYTITVKSANTSMGTVTGGATNQVRGAVVTLSATPLSGYKFLQWDDGSTQNPRSIVVEGDKTYTAQFSTSGGSGFGA